MAVNSNTRAVIGGSGVTVIRWSYPGQQSEVIGFARSVTVTAPKAVAPEVPVQPIDRIRPIEVVAAYAQSYGTISLTLTQIYRQDAWQRLAGLSLAQDFTDVSREIAGQTNPHGVVIERWMTPPVPLSGINANNTLNSYSEAFFQCVLTDIGDDVPVDVTTMLLDKVLTFAYAYSIKRYVNSGKQLHKSAPIVNTGEIG